MHIFSPTRDTNASSQAEQSHMLPPGIEKPMHNSMRYKPNITEPIYNGFKGLLIDSTNRLHVIVLAQTIRDNPN